MSERRAGLRLRLFSGVLGAGLLAMALLAVTTLLEVRDALYARRIADARERLHTAVVAAGALCQQGDEEGLRRCREQGLALLALAGAMPGAGEGGIPAAGPCASPLERRGGRALLCENLPGSAGELHGIRLAVDLEPVREQLAALDARLLAGMAAALVLLVLLSVWLLERGVVRRLAGIDTALDTVGGEAATDTELLPEGGDALGRLGAAVNRLAARLREERERTRGQIGTLERANRALAEEKRALREAREDLARSERLASVGRLAAGVAHEVGNPISAVIAYAALLREKAGVAPAVNPAIAEYAGRIEREAARVDRILRDLLDLARPQALRLEALDLPRALQAAHALVEPQPAWQGCALALFFPQPFPKVQGEEHYVVQVLVNLLANAARAGAREVRVSGRDEGDRIALEVADDGRGIAAENLPHLFEPFFTTSAPGEGTGLGLALCHATMERIGGSIEAQAPASGKGALFVLRFRPAPRAPGSAPGAAAVE